MLVIAVEFQIKPEHAPEFMVHMLRNAQSSLANEPGCKCFDVCVDPDAPGSVFLYELYDDQAAFDAHLKTAHFLQFDAATATWIQSKQVRRYQLQNNT
jgi:(4S)-4-hydroxy-5-phosphonooxypentane-2,3-dione isomerase